MKDESQIALTAKVAQQQQQPPSRRSGCRPKKRRQKESCCAHVNSSQPIKHPNLAIYSQDEQLSLGNVPSWDNPDMTTNSWRPFRLNPESLIVVRNLSSTVSAVNGLVHFYTSPFGIGMPRTLLATRMVSILPASQVQLNFPLPAATLTGDQRIGVHVVLEHPQDTTPLNNRGSQVHDGAYTTESGRNFNVSIPVLNDSNFSNEIKLTILPTDLTTSITPASHTFAPHEQITATLHITVPAALVGSAASEIHRAVTVVGRLATGNLVGGVTRLLRIDN